MEHAQRSRILSATLNKINHPLLCQNEPEQFSHNINVKVYYAKIIHSLKFPNQITLNQTFHQQQPDSVWQCSNTVTRSAPTDTYHRYYYHCCFSCSTSQCFPALLQTEGSRKRRLHIQKNNDTNSFNDYNLMPNITYITKTNQPSGITYFKLTSIISTNY